jgi:hypothetical protein
VVVVVEVVVVVVEVDVVEVDVVEVVDVDVDELDVDVLEGLGDVVVDGVVAGVAAVVGAPVVAGATGAGLVPLGASPPPSGALVGPGTATGGAGDDAVDDRAEATEPGEVSGSESGVSTLSAVRRSGASVAASPRPRLIAAINPTARKASPRATASQAWRDGRLSSSSRSPGIRLPPPGHGDDDAPSLMTVSPSRVL